MNFGMHYPVGFNDVFVRLYEIHEVVITISLVRGIIYRFQIVMAGSFNG